MLQPICPPAALRRLAVAVVAIAVAAASLAAQTTPASLKVHVGVVDRDGQPINGITADKFEVEVAGRRRKVISATFVTGAEAAASYVIAVDALSFGPGGSKATIAAVRTFLGTLAPGSRVGLATLPQGPSIEVTTNLDAVRTELDRISGQLQAGRAGTFGLGAADVIDYLGASDRTSIITSFCGTEEDNACPSLLDQEVGITVNSLETQARASLGMLSTLATRMVAMPGRKVLVLVGGGLPVAERSGMRPDVGNLPGALADAAARGDISLYGLLLDRRMLDADVGTTRHRAAASPARESDVLGRWLDQFSTSVGGAMLRVQNRDIGPGYTRIAREMTGHYTLAVEATESDKPGALQRLRVRVDHRGATLRSRQIVEVK